MKLTLRPFRAEDLDAVLRLWLEANLQAHAFLPAAYWEEQLPAVREALPRAEITLCVADGALAGFLGRTGNHIEGLFVRDSLRGQGVGALLLAQAKQCCGTLWLEVYAENRDALRFYLREGFAVAQELPLDRADQRAFRMRWPETEKSPV